jgi:GTP cyclohydrolase II
MIYVDSMKYSGPIKLPVLLVDRETIANFKLYYFELPHSGGYYVLEKGEVKATEWPLVRIHSACNIAHIFNSQRCDCQAQLELAMQLMHHARRGLLIYIVNHEGRGVGPFNHIRVYQKQDEGFDTVDSYIELGLSIDQRGYDDVKQILDWFEIKRVRLLTNNPKKIESLARMGFEVQREPLIAKLHKYNQSQIKAKIKKLGHLIPYPDENYDNNNHNQSGK